MSDTHSGSVYVQIKLPCKKTFPFPFNPEISLDKIFAVTLETSKVKTRNWDVWHCLKLVGLMFFC